MRFIDHVGFCVLFPLKSVPLPSLYFAVSRRRYARWDKHAELIWKWKDDLPKKRRAFYGKYFKGRGTFLSLTFLPYFIAMRESAAAAEDGQALYGMGRISHDAGALWQALAKHGPMATLELRHSCKMETKAANIRFKKAILELQCLLIVTHFGAEQETEAWASNRFELTSRAFPKQVMAARDIAPQAARTVLASKYLAFYPAAPVMQIARLFGWTKAEALSAMR